MKNPSEPRGRRRQRDSRLPFKVAVVGEVGRGELRDQQAPRRSGSQGRRTGRTWGRRYATQFVTSQAAGPTCPGAAPAGEQPPAPRLQALQRQLRAQKRWYEQPRGSHGPAAIVTHEAAGGGGGPRQGGAKKGFSPAVSKLVGEKKRSTQPRCWRAGVRRQGLYPRRPRPARQARRQEAVLAEVQRVGRQQPRLGRRKLRPKPAPRLRAQGRAGQGGAGPASGALVALLRREELLVPKKRRYPQTTDSHHRFRKHANLVQDAPTPAAPNRRSVREITSLPPRQGTGHLRLLTEACSRRIAGHHLHASLPPDGCPEALARAVRGAGTAAPGSVHASERGSQYCSAASQAARRAAGLRCSRSDGYACYPNARAERGNGILKADVLLLLPDDLAQARLLVEQAVHRSNEERPPLSLKYLSPPSPCARKTPAGKSGRGPCPLSVSG